MSPLNFFRKLWHRNEKQYTDAFKGKKRRVFAFFLIGIPTMTIASLQSASKEVTLFENLQDRINTIDEAPLFPDLQETVGNVITEKKSALEQNLNVSAEDWRGEWKQKFDIVQNNWQSIKPDFQAQTAETVSRVKQKWNLDDARFAEFEKLAGQVKNRFGIKTSIEDYLGQLRYLYEKTGSPYLPKPELNKPWSRREVFVPEFRTVPLPQDQLFHIEMKLVQDGPAWRVQDGKLINRKALEAEVGQDTYDFLQEKYWNPEVILELETVMNEFFHSVIASGGTVTPLIKGVSEDQKTNWYEEGSSANNQEISELNTWISFQQKPDEPFPEGVCEMMYALGVAEYCNYVPEITLENMTVTPPGASDEIDIPDLSPDQGYLKPAPLGVDAEYAWNFTGGEGENVTIYDIEGGWEVSHADFPSFVFQSGNSYDPDFREHGTAVVGQMVALNNDYGVTGIANKSKIGTVSFFDGGVTNAIGLAISKAKKGDVVLLELQARGPGSGQSCECNCGQFEQIPMEYWQSNYDIIETAVKRGVVVITPAGNGSMDLDEVRYGGKFDPEKRDSGAIFVGGGGSEDKEPHCWTNYGKRVNLFSWGDTVYTTGYGDLSSTEDPRYFYTADFKGTSSAAPIVAGAAALLQSVYTESSKKFLSPKEIREIFQTTGTAQAVSYKNIGKQPDLRRALASLSGKITPKPGFSVPIAESEASSGTSLSGNFVWYLGGGFLSAAMFVLFILFLRRRSQRV